MRHQVMDPLRRDHRLLEHLLNLFERQLRAFQQGEDPDFELLCELLCHVDVFAEKVHHPTEDLIFAQLLRRPEAPAEALNRVMEQHHSLRQVSRDFRQGMEAIVNEALLSRGHIETLGQTFLAAQREHLALEETQVLPAAERLLADADWAEVLAQAPNRREPLEGLPESRFRDLVRQVEGMGGLLSAGSSG